MVLDSLMFGQRNGSCHSIQIKQRMIFANTEIPAFNLTLNNKNIPLTTSHKHLGVAAMANEQSC